MGFMDADIRNLFLIFSAGVVDVSPGTFRIILMSEGVSLKIPGAA